MLIKISFRKQSEIQNYFGELYITANEPRPQHPKRKRMDKMDHKLSWTPNDAHHLVCLVLETFFSLTQPD